MNLRLLCALGAALLALASCGAQNPIGLNILGLRTLDPTCDASSVPGKKALALAFNYTGQLDSLKLSFTPYSLQANPVNPTQIVRIADVTAPPSYVRVLLNESTVVRLFVVLTDAQLSSQGVTPPDVKQTRPMNLRVEATNKQGQSAGALELKDVDVSGCY